MAFQFVWLSFSYGVVFSFGVVILDQGQFIWAFALFVLFPVLRILNRFRNGKGYYIIGYIGEVGGELPIPSSYVTRYTTPLRFKFYLIIEVLIIGFLLASVFIR